MFWRGEESCAFALQKSGGREKHEREEEGEYGLLRDYRFETDRMSLIVLAGDVQGSPRQPTRVGANSTGPIVVIDSSVVFWH